MAHRHTPRTERRSNPPLSRRADPSCSGDLVYPPGTACCVSTRRRLPSIAAAGLLAMRRPASGRTRSEPASPVGSGFAGQNAPLWLALLASLRSCPGRPRPAGRKPLSPCPSTGLGERGRRRRAQPPLPTASHGRGREYAAANGRSRPTYAAHGRTTTDPRVTAGAGSRPQTRPASNRRGLRPCDLHRVQCIDASRVCGTLRRPASAGPEGRKKERPIFERER